jgi:hypothetical protein
MTQTQRPNGRADFDFEIGRWQVQHRHVKHVLQGPTNWEEFTGILVARKILGGLGLLDEISNERATGSFQGITLHLFDPQKQQWSVYPANSPQGVLAVPMIGGFTNGRGGSYSHAPIDGMHRFTRLLWHEITPSSYRWEQAYSAEGGATWETNWIQGHARLPE